MKKLLLLFCFVGVLFISSCSTGPLCPAFSSEHHSIFSMNMNPFSKGFVTSHGTGPGRSPLFSFSNIGHGGFGEWMNPFSSSRSNVRGGANQAGPFTIKGGIKHGGGGGDALFATNSKHHSSANGTDSFKKKDKRHGDKPPDKKNETGLWPKSMRLKD